MNGGILHVLTGARSVYQLGYSEIFGGYASIKLFLFSCLSFLSIQHQ